MHQMHQRKTVQPQMTARGIFGGYSDLAGYEKHIERRRAELASAAAAPPKKPKKVVAETITTPRHQANYGAVCNPWLDNVPGAKYFPLLDWIASDPQLTSGAKKFHAVLLYRARMCHDWLRTDKLIEETSYSARRVYKYLRLFIAKDLIKKGRFKGIFHLVDWKGRELELMNDTEYNTLHKSRIAQSLVSSGLVSSSDSAVVVYGRLCGMAGEKGFWHGKNEDLCTECGVTLNTLRAAVRKLEDQKLIRVDRYGAGNGGGRRIHKSDGGRLNGGGENVYHFLGHRIFRLKEPRP